jgi:glycyl-tRNA synthetase
MGIAARGDFDLKQHSSHSGKLLEYHDPSTNLKYIPHVIEPSIGVERLFLALLCSAYREEVVENEKRVVLGLHPAIAPIKACILPLVSNKLEIAKFSKEIYDSLKTRFMVEYDSSGAIGRRYRRADESGTPFCITVDFDSLSDNSVTIRMRDSMQQFRLPAEELIGFLSKEIGFY